MSNVTLESLATEIRSRMDTMQADLDERVETHVRASVPSDTELEERIKAMLPGLLDSEPDIIRKVRGWGQPDGLAGSKYARRGLTAADVELLHNMMSAGQAANMTRGPSEELTRAFNAVSDGYYRSADAASAEDRRALERQVESGHLTRAAYEHAIRAMDTQESGFGQQLIGAQYVGDLWQSARTQSRVFSLIESFEATEATTYIPVEVDIPEMLYVGESTEANSSDYATVKTGSQRIQITPSTFNIHQVYSGQMEEDSIIPWLPYLRRQAGLSVEHHLDSLVLNGDTTTTASSNINLIDSTPAATKHYLAFDGLRHAFLVDNTANGTDAGGTVTWDALQRLRNLMIDDPNIVDWGNPSMDNDVAYIADPRTVNAITNLDEVLTYDKFGANATVLTGQLAKIGRHPLISSQALRLTNSAGKVSATSGNNTKGTVVAFNRNGFKAAWRRRVQLETERLPGRDQTRLIWSLRLGFGRFSPTGSASGIEAVAGLYNVSLS